MSVKDFIINFWRNVAEQNAQKLGMFFSHDAEIKWHCTNERFNVKEFVKVNCEYPGKWNAEIERLEQCDKTVVSVVRVWNETSSFHVTSFFNIENGLIKVLEEYWGDDGIAPKWRISMKIGSAVKKRI